MKRTLTLALLAALAWVPAMAQTTLPANSAQQWKDTSLFKPPAGARIAIIEFEDLECPHCGHAAPIVRAAVKKDHLAYQHHDFPLHAGMWWSLNAAITARYLQDMVSPERAEEYRLDVFANQSKLSSEDDLARYTAQWFQKHGLQRPFVFDPKLKAEVMADSRLGERVGVNETPTIIVATDHGWIDVKDVLYLDQAIAQAEKMAGAAAPAAPAAHNNVRKAVMPAR